MTAQPDSCIVINAEVTQNACFIQPIRNVITKASTSNLLCYDTTSKELVTATNINFLNLVRFTTGTGTGTQSSFILVH